MRTFLLTFVTILFFIAPAQAQIFGDCSQGDADFRWSTDGCCVTFYACNSAGFGTYNFGDGNSAIGQGAYHCYGSPGTYLVTKTFNGQTASHLINITSCEVECDLTATYCPDGGPCYTDYVPGSHYYYYCYQTYNATTTGGTPPFTYDWQICYTTNFGTQCQNFSGSSINPIRYQVYYIWNGGWQLIYRRYISSVCLTVTDANGCEYENCQGCILPRPNPGDDVSLALPDGGVLSEVTAEGELPTEPTIFPNIAQAGQLITVILPYFELDGQPLPARLFSLSGQLLEQYNLTPGRSQLQLPTGLSSGVYLLQFSDGAGGTTSHKVVVR